MTDSNSFEEKDIWNYRKIASRKISPGTVDQKQFHRKDTVIEVISSDEEQSGCVTEVASKRDFHVTNSKAASEWASVFSRKKESDSSNNEKSSKNQRKRKRSTSQSSHGLNAKSKTKSNLECISKVSLSCSSKNVLNFNPRKLTPEIREPRIQYEIEELPDISESTGHESDCLYNYNQEEEKQNCLSSKIVDVIVVGSEYEDNFSDGNASENAEETTGSNSQTCEDIDEDCAGGFVNIESEHEAGGFLKSENDDEDCVNKCNDDNNVKQEISKSDVFSNSSEKLQNKFNSYQLGDNTKCTDHLHTSNAPSLKAARKQSSLLSFFGSKSLSKDGNESVVCDRVGPRPSLPKHQTFNNGNFSNKNQHQSKPSNSFPGSSKSWSASSAEDVKYNGGRKQCPFYKKIPDTNITVDAFRYGTIPGCNVYFLTHFHYDHYGGLTKKFAHPIYCSAVTGNLVEKRLGVDQRWIRRLPLWQPVVVDGVTLTLMEANHCPGAVIVLFETRNGKKILHTGDFRASIEMEDYLALKNVIVDELYLDTTYCNPSYAFPSQKKVIDFTLSLVKDQIARDPKTLIVCGAYTIGKERIFAAIAKMLDSKICVMSDKKKVLDCLEDEDLKQRISQVWSQGQVHVLPMAKLKLESLLEHHSRHSSFTSLLAFEPTGWTHNAKAIGLDTLKPKWSRNRITLYGVPYSEHSSFLELKRFVQFTRPKKILPTVNNGNATARKKMENIFQTWLNEKKSSVESNCAGTSQQLKLENWMKL